MLTGRKNNLINTQTFKDEHPGPQVAAKLERLTSLAHLFYVIKVFINLASVFYLRLRTTRENKYAVDSINSQ